MEKELRTNEISEEMIGADEKNTCSTVIDEILARNGSGKNEEGEK